MDSCPVYLIYLLLLWFYLKKNLRCLTHRVILINVEVKNKVGVAYGASSEHNQA